MYSEYQYDYPFRPYSGQHTILVITFRQIKFYIELSILYNKNLDVMGRIVLTIFFKFVIDLVISP
jgi:hypothetical protein